MKLAYLLFTCALVLCSASTETKHDETMDFDNLLNVPRKVVRVQRSLSSRLSHANLLQQRLHQRSKGQQVGIFKKVVKVVAPAVAPVSNVASNTVSTVASTVAQVAPQVLASSLTRMEDLGQYIKTNTPTGFLGCVFNSVIQLGSCPASLVGQTCTGKGNCNIQIGPQCLKVAFDRTFSQDLGYGITVSGSAVFSGSATVSVNPLTGDISVALDLTATLSATLSLSQAVSYSKVQNLLQTNAPVFKQLIMAGYVPILLEFYVIPKVWIDFQASGSLSFTVTSVNTINGQFGLAGGQLTKSFSVSPGIPTFNIQGQATATLDVRIGPSFVIKVNTIELVALDLAVHGRITGTLSLGPGGCLNAQVSLSAGFDLQTSAGFSFDPIATATAVCEQSVSQLAAQALPATVIASCAGADVPSDLADNLCRLMTSSISEAMGGAGKISVSIPAGSWVELIKFGTITPVNANACVG